MTEEAPRVVEPEIEPWQWAGIAICALIPIGLVVYFAVQDPLKAEAELCDRAIQETLKAPSTYQRIQFSGSRGFYSIEYDAENSGIM